MEDKRFDSLTRVMATGRSRREMLKLLVGGTAGGILVASVIDDAAAECHGIACSSDSGCCVGAPYCNGGVCSVSAPAPAPAPAAPADTSTATTAMPAAGTGPLGSDDNSWAGVALAGGAAAWLGSRLLRKQNEASDEA